MLFWSVDYTRTKRLSCALSAQREEMPLGCNSATQLKNLFGIENVRILRFAQNETYGSVIFLILTVSDFFDSLIRRK